MPKTRTYIERGIKPKSNRIKYKLGNRESTKSAITLKNDELLKLFENTVYKRDKPLIQRLLNKRGIHV